MNTKTIKGKTLGIFLSLALILSLAAVALPATPVYAATNYYVDALGTDDGSHGTSAGAGAFKTIQYAIDDARVVATDTIIVAAGIYTGDLIINKDITLRSASGKTSTTIQLVDGVGIDIQAAGAGCTLGGALNTGFTITPHATATTFDIQLANAPSGVLISYNAISTVGTVAMGISVGAAGATGLIVTNNTFTAEAGDGSIWGPIVVNVTISNNTFTGPGSTTSGYAVQFSGVTGTSTISGNTITGYGTGVRVSHGEGTSGLTISSNTITGCSSGIRFEEYKATAGPDGNMTTVTVTGNTLSTNTIGLRVDDGAHVLANTFTIQYNKFTGNTTCGLQNNHATLSVTAERNWWNSNTGPIHASNPGGTGDIVSDNVDFTPWLQVVSVTDPAGGACVMGGSSYLVQWTAYSVPSATATFEVYNGTSWVAGGTLGGTFNGNYTTSVPMPTVNSSSCKVKVTISGGGGATYYAESGTFRIDSTAPSVGLGAIASCLKGGSSVILTFNVGDTGSTSLDFVIQYSLDGTTAWTDISPTASFNEASGTKTKSWTVPSENSNACKWRVTATDCAGNATPATSTSTFTIDSTAPTPVTVIQPNGGGTPLTAGGTYTIKWNALDNLAGNLNYTIKYSTDSGGTYPNTIAGPFSGAQGSSIEYTWTVPGASSITCRVRVTAEDCATNSTSDDSNANFTIQDTTAPTVTVTSPNGGESWAAGSAQTVSWTANDNVAGDLNIKIYYTFDYPTEQCIWEEPSGGIGPQPQGPGSYTWTVPTPLETKTTCRVKVEATDAAGYVGSDIGDGNFTIAICSLPPTVTLDSPNGGESWQGGTCKTITWRASEPADPDYTLDYVLKYSTNGGGTYPNTIATLSNRDQDSQSFCWAVPTTADTDYRVKIEVTGCGGMTPDASTNFTVTTADAAVTTASITLQTGWNLISLELMPTCCPSTSTSCCTGYPIEDILANVLANVSGVWYWTGGASGTWQMWSPGAPSSLTAMTDGKAYWVYASSGGTFTYQGRKGPAGGGFPTTPYSYVAGWNMVGFKSTIIKDVQDYLGGTCGGSSPTYVTPIYCWDAAAQGWCSPSPSCTDSMTPDSGYWVLFNTAHTVNAGAD